jgi:hypothetical protein
MITNLPGKNTGHRRAPKIILACGLLLLCGSLLFAVAMSGGLFQMLKTLIVSGGGSANQTGGPYSLASSVGQPNAQILRGGPYELRSGYHSYALPSPSAAPQIVSVAISSQVVWEGIPTGVPWNAPLNITFNEPMNAGTLAAAVQVTVLRDKNANYPLNSPPVPINVAYQTGALTASVTPVSPWNSDALSSNTWNSNTLYELTIATTALSAGGLALAAPYAGPFLTIFDFALNNTYISGPLVNGIPAAQLLVPANIMPKDGYIIISTDPLHHPDLVDPTLIQLANNKIVSNSGTFETPITIVEIEAFDANSNHIPLAEANVLSLILPYPDANGNVANIQPPIPVSTLALWTLDESSSLWLREPEFINNTQVQPGMGTVGGPISHLSVFAIIGQASQTDVSQVYAYPIPWKPFSNNPQRYGTLADGINFINLPSEGTLKIYTVSGELVQSFAIGGQQNQRWLGTNSRGQKVASGVYLWEIQAGSNQNTGKLMIVW